MIIDLHFHTERFSSCSRIPLDRGIERARERGLDGICITEHDVLHKGSDIIGLERRYGIKIFVGTEILSREGDILCFGLEGIPGNRMPASELVTLVNKIGGATIAAHPFRINNRGVKELFTSLEGLSAVEAFNGNTSDENNRRALELALAEGIPVVGGSDSHTLEKVGCFATEFPGTVASESDLCRALRNGGYAPLRYTERGFEVIDSEGC